MQILFSLTPEQESITPPPKAATLQEHAKIASPLITKKPKIAAAAHAKDADGDYFFNTNNPVSESVEDAFLYESAISNPFCDA